jgi:putative nucleotidyltransferase with HDIG domain
MIQIPIGRRKCSSTHGATAVSSLDRVIHALLELMKARDPELAAHSLSVAHLSAGVASALGLCAPHIDVLRRAALIHDVGKLTLPDSVLRKPGPLTAREYHRVRQHPVMSYRIGLGLGLRDEARWVRHHHERPDGQGYPDGLGAGQIPLESEIIHVADAYDALVTDRPYRGARTHGEALEEIVAGSGPEFERDCVSALAETTARRFGRT